MGFVPGEKTEKKNQYINTSYTIMVFKNNITLKNRPLCPYRQTCFSKFSKERRFLQIYGCFVFIDTLQTASVHSRHSTCENKKQKCFFKIDYSLCEIKIMKNTFFSEGKLKNF